MKANNFLKKAVDFAFSDPVVDKHLKWRDLNGYTPLGINVRYAHFKNFEKDLIRLQFDYEKPGSPNYIPEDFVLYLTWDDKKYKVHWIGPVGEVPG